MSDFWDTINLATGECRLWQSAGFRAWVRLDDEDVLVAIETDLDCPVGADVATVMPAEPPENLPWDRWLSRGLAKTVRLVPAMPDRPVVVRPSLPLHIAFKQKEEFFITIPAWIRVIVGKADELCVSDKPSQTLSNTWFGDPMQGELGYSLATAAQTNIAKVEHKPLSVLCPVTIQNEHKNPLFFERLCIRTEHLSIYNSPLGLLSNTVKVTYQGEQEMSRIKYATKPPAFTKDITPLAPARRSVEKNLIRKSFSTIISYASEA